MIVGDDLVRNLKYFAAVFFGSRRRRCVHLTVKVLVSGWKPSTV